MLNKSLPNKEFIRLDFPLENSPKKPISILSSKDFWNLSLTPSMSNF